MLFDFDSVLNLAQNIVEHKIAEMICNGGKRAVNINKRVINRLALGGYNSALDMMTV